MSNNIFGLKLLICKYISKNIQITKSVQYTKLVTLFVW